MTTRGSLDRWTFAIGIRRALLLCDSAIPVLSWTSGMVPLGDGSR